MTDGNSLERAIFAGGCFWCLEYELKKIKGVRSLVSGYIGGTVDHPAYEQVCAGTTGHAEAVEILFDPDLVSFKDLLTVFLTRAHDPTQKNRQGVDIGSQYRSAVFPVTAGQEKAARDTIAQLNAGAFRDKPIATTIEPAATFWPAEEYHQDYYSKYQARHGQEHIRVQMKKQRA